MTKYNFPVYLVNLENAHERRESSLKQLHELEINPIVVPACNGHQKDFPFYQYRHLSRGKWWEKNVFKPGAFACYLSHAKCWEKIAMGSAPYAMILEDDMIIDHKAFQKFNIDNVPNSFDILFVSIGVTRLLKLTSFDKSQTTKDFASLNESLLDLLNHHKFNDNLTPGSYGYFVSKKGAAKLLEMMKQNKVCMGVDYAMVFGSLDNIDIEKIKKINDIPGYLQVYLDNIDSDASALNQERTCLDSYIYTLPALITHDDNVVSDLKHEIYVDFNIFDNSNLMEPCASVQKEKNMDIKEQTLYDLFGFDAVHVDYLINISNKYKYIYFETPKVGCSTIKNTLQKLEVDDESKLPDWVHDKHLSPLLSPLELEKNFTEYINDEYFKFSFVRNPYTRILSCYLDKILGIEKDVMLPKLGFKSTDYLSFYDFLQAVKSQSYSEMDVHWMPQSILLASESITLDFIGRQENFDNDLKKVLVKITKSDPGSLHISNETPHAVGANKKLQKYMTKGIAKLILEIYYDDFYLYGYSRDPFYIGKLPSLPISTLDTLTENSLVSIIIPCYNQAQYLEESVQSAVDQTYPNIEIIIVNDGSSDNTQEVAEELQKRYPDTIRIVTQENQGISEARNTGIRESLGEYILPLDSDDILDPKIISKYVNTMIQNSADIVYSDLQRFEKNQDIRLRKPFSENNILYENLPHGSSLYRKEVWAKNKGYKQNMKEGYEDWEFWINAYKHNFTFHHLPEVLFYYRIKDESRDTNAYKKDTYLKAEIMMNHPELYTAIQVQEAIVTIKETEELADLYFYYDKSIPGDEETLLAKAGCLIAGNPSKKKQIIIIDDKKIGLCTLELLQNNKSIQKLYKKMGIDFLLFYAPLRYDAPSLQNLDFAWDRDNGIVETHGSIFPFVFKSVRESSKLQLTAYQKEREYLRYISDKDAESAQKKLDWIWAKYNTEKNATQKKLDSLQHKLNMDTEISQKLDASIGRYNLIMELVSDLIGTPAKTKPLQKISSYKTLTKAYFELRKAENEKK